MEILTTQSSVSTASSIVVVIKLRVFVLNKIFVFFNSHRQPLTYCLHRFQRNLQLSQMFHQMYPIQLAKQQQR